MAGDGAGDRGSVTRSLKSSNVRRPWLILGRVTTREDWALWACVRSSVWTLIYDRPSFEVKDVKWLHTHTHTHSWRLALCKRRPLASVNSPNSILSLHMFRGASKPYEGLEPQPKHERLSWSCSSNNLLKVNRKMAPPGFEPATCRSETDTLTTHRA